MLRLSTGPHLHGVRHPATHHRLRLVLGSLPGAGTDSSVPATQQIPAAHLATVREASDSVARCPRAKTPRVAEAHHRPNHPAPGENQEVVRHTHPEAATPHAANASVDPAWPRHPADFP